MNLADLQGDGGIPNKQKLKKKKKAEGPKPVFNIKDIPAPHKIKASLDEYVVGQEKAKKVISVAVVSYTHLDVYKRQGYLLGKNYRRLPKKWVLAFTSNKEYWKQNRKDV